MDYKIEKSWRSIDYPCVVVMTNMGHRCGYVGVPETHPLYGVEYRVVYEDYNTGVLRTLEFCFYECIKLADQLREVEKQYRFRKELLERRF